MKVDMRVEEYERLKAEFLREQKFALITTRGRGESHDQVSWLNKSGLADFVIGMWTPSGKDYTAITLKVPVDRAETIKEYIRFMERPCWGDVHASVVLEDADAMSSR